jgi:hypothetical protein
VNHIFREGNIVADFLTKCRAEGLNSNWFENQTLPCPLRGFLYMDKLGMPYLRVSKGFVPSKFRLICLVFFLLCLVFLQVTIFLVRSNLG